MAAAASAPSAPSATSPPGAVLKELVSACSEKAMLGEDALPAVGVEVGWRLWTTRTLSRCDTVTCDRCDAARKYRFRDS